MLSLALSPSLGRGSGGGQRGARATGAAQCRLGAGAGGGRGGGGARRRKSIPQKPSTFVAATASSPPAKSAPAPPPAEKEGETGPDYSWTSSSRRSLALELVRVTEAAALSGARWLGKGDKNAADKAAVDVMRRVLNTIPMDGVIVIGEGEKDNAPMLYCGERVGDSSAPHALKVDVAVDPLDGTSLVAGGRGGAVAVIAVAERGAMFDPGPVMYMDKLAVGPQVNPHRVSLAFPVAQNLASVAEALSKPVSEVTVCILDRPRHAELIRQVRAAGARIRLISDGDVAGAIECARPLSPVDVMMGIGGTPEGVVAAAALKCLGGSIQGRLAPREEFGEKEKALALGYDLSKILYTEDLCSGDEVFFAATGVSDGDLLRGVRFEGKGRGRTQSMVMRAASGTVRVIDTEHRWGQARAGKREAVTAPTATGAAEE